MEADVTAGLTGDQATTKKPWHGVVVAIATPFKDDLSVDFGRLQEHVRWLADEGCDGVTPNGSLGEYQTLSDQERSDIVRAVVEAAPSGCSVVPGVGAYGSHQARRWAEDAAAAGADAVLSLPPNAYRATDEEVVAHYRAVAAAGLPVVTYNNPYDTKVDLTPELLATIAEIDGIVAVKEFSGDVRRLHRIRELVTHLDVLAGADDVLLELVMLGSPGWIAGLPNALPRASVRLFSRARRASGGSAGVASSGDTAAGYRGFGPLTGSSGGPRGVVPAASSSVYEDALALYRRLHPIFRWDSRPEFIQAIKLAMHVAGRYGGPCRPPRLPLPEEQAAQVRKDAELALQAEVSDA
jgi:4-hydroxy-tetrahydrodipicolinate synthase